MSELSLENLDARLRELIDEGASVQSVKKYLKRLGPPRSEHRLPGLRAALAHPNREIAWQAAQLLLTLGNRDDRWHVLAAYRDRAERLPPLEARDDEREGPGSGLAQALSFLRDHDLQVRAPWSLPPPPTWREDSLTVPWSFAKPWKVHTLDGDMLVFEPGRTSVQLGVRLSGDLSPNPEIDPDIGLDVLVDDAEGGAWELLGITEDTNFGEQVLETIELRTWRGQTQSVSEARGSESAPKSWWLEDPPDAVQREPSPEWLIRDLSMLTFCDISREVLLVGPDEIWLGFEYTAAHLDVAAGADGNLLVTVTGLVDRWQLRVPPFVVRVPWRTLLRGLSTPPQYFLVAERREPREASQPQPLVHRGPWDASS
ncbi:MAG: hypothetical protein AAF533_12210 [Acidobacteriota bacterium]